jgi:predicted ATPase
LIHAREDSAFMSLFDSSELTLVHATAVWQVQLLGGLQARRGDILLRKFGSRSVAALLARLALYPQRSHAREELIELLWPGVTLDVGRNRLRQALFTLRQWLEPPGPVPAPVLVADRLSVRVVSGAFDCDALRFERCVREGRHAQALALYVGELLPGFYDEWIHDERLRLAALFERASAAPSADHTVLHVAAAAPGAAAVSVDLGRSTLPVYLTRFFGRETEGARLRAEVLGHRLVALLGPGGSGKTRLAVELAQALRESGAAHAHAAGASGESLDQRFDLVAFVSLVNCGSRAQLLDALLASLHLRQHDDDAFEPLIVALSGRRALLVLDNFEQLSGLAEDVIARLVQVIPGLHLLVTSRRVLGLDGEREFLIQALLLPRAGLPLDEAAINPALALFVDRARAVRADFHIGPGNLAALIDVVHLLEGMPLALELAAARVRSIAPAAMAGLLRAARTAPGGHALALLNRSGPRSGGDLRHASMLRVIEWSWRLLDPPQACLLAALTVFHGGFSAAAVQAVCGDLASDASVRLDELVSHSLLRVNESAAGATRYATFEPVREYAALQLDAATASALRARHRAWLADWVAALPPTPVLAEVRIETPNLLAALASALLDDAADASIRMLLPLRRVLEDVELPAEGLAALKHAVERSTDAVLCSQGHTLLGPLLFLAGRRDDALRHAELGLAGAPPGSHWRAPALHAVARVRWRATRQADRVIELLDEAEPLARAAGDKELLASVHALRAFVVNSGRRHADREALHVQALALWEQLGNQHAINSGRYNLAVCSQNAGRHEETLVRLSVIEASARELQDWRRLSQMLNVRGNALSGLRRWGEAAASFRDSAQLAWDCLALHELAYVLWNLPRALAHLREPARAVQLAAFAEAFWQARFGRLSDADRHDLRRVRRLVARQLDAPRIEALWAQGAQLSPAEAMTLALR